jgi:hypothetical protein
MGPCSQRLQQPWKGCDGQQISRHRGIARERRSPSAREVVANAPPLLLAKRCRLGLLTTLAAVGLAFGSVTVSDERRSRAHEDRLLERHHPDVDAHGEQPGPGRSAKRRRDRLASFADDVRLGLTGVRGLGAGNRSLHGRLAGERRYDIVHDRHHHHRPGQRLDHQLGDGDQRHDRPSDVQQHRLGAGPTVTRTVEDEGGAAGRPRPTSSAYGVSVEANSLAGSPASVFVKSARNWPPSGASPT